MAVLKQTSPTTTPVAPRPCPQKTVPSAKTSAALAPVGRMPSPEPLTPHPAGCMEDSFPRRGAAPGRVVFPLLCGISEGVPARYPAVKRRVGFVAIDMGWGRSGVSHPIHGDGDKRVAQYISASWLAVKTKAVKNHQLFQYLNKSVLFAIWANIL